MVKCKSVAHRSSAQTWLNQLMPGWRNYYGLNHISSKFIYWSPTPRYLRMWPYLELGSLQMWLVKLEWGHTGMGGVPNPTWLMFLLAGQTRTQTCLQGETYVKRLRKTAICLQAKEESWNRFFSHSPQKNQTYQHLEFGLWTPELWQNKFLLFRVSQLGYFVWQL